MNGSVAKRPTEPHELVRVGDRISYLYLERCVVNRDSNAITATDERGIVHIPAASVGALLLGPGTTITHQAIMLMADSGSTVVWMGEHGVRYYAHGTALARSSRLLEAQAAAVTNRRSRLRVAREMYAMRFPGEDVSKLTMQQLRGREGARIRSVYREHSDRTGVLWTRRDYDRDDWEAGDRVNRALSAANACLYGVVHSVIVAMGCAPGLGFVHTGHQRSFVYDMADLYKAEITIPMAFDVAADDFTIDDEIGGQARRRVRDKLHDGKLLEQCSRDIDRLLTPSGETSAAADDDVDYDDISIWDEYDGPVPGGVSYGADE